MTAPLPSLVRGSRFGRPLCGTTRGLPQAPECAVHWNWKGVVVPFPAPIASLPASHRPPILLERMFDAMERLNPEQRAAVEPLGGPLLVVAGAGSGKTSTLACRVARLVD